MRNVVRWGDGKTIRGDSAQSILILTIAYSQKYTQNSTPPVNLYFASLDSHAFYGNEGVPATAGRETYSKHLASSKPLSNQNRTRNFQQRKTNDRSGIVYNSPEKNKISESTASAHLSFPRKTHPTYVQDPPVNI